jgi:hypothetical protein
MRAAGIVTGTLILAFAVPTLAAWIPAVTLSDPGDFARLAEVAIDRKGNAIVVWRGFDGTNYRARAAFRPRGGSFGPVQTLSAASEDAGEPGSGPQIAFDGKGNAIAVWHRSDGTHERIEAAIQPAGGTFGTAETISDPGLDARFPQIAFDKKGTASRSGRRATARTTESGRPSAPREGPSQPR